MVRKSKMFMFNSSTGICNTSKKFERDVTFYETVEKTARIDLYFFSSPRLQRAVFSRRTNYRPYLLLTPSNAKSLLLTRQKQYPSLSCNGQQGASQHLRIVSYCTSFLGHSPVVGGTCAQHSLVCVGI